MPKIHRATFAVGPGAANDIVELNPIDISRFDCLEIWVKVTTADTDLADELDFRLQCTTDRVNWHTRARTLFTGDMSPSATVPEYRVLRLCQAVDLSANEEVHEPGGSAGTTVLTAEQVINGPFPSLYRDATLQQLMPNWRTRIILTDADSDASFAGDVVIYGLCRAY